MQSAENSSSMLPKHFSPDWNHIPAIKLIAKPTLKNQNTILLKTSFADFHLQILSHGIRLRTVNQRELNYGLLVSEPEVVTVTAEISESKSLFLSQNYKLVLQHYPFSFQLLDLKDVPLASSANDGHFVRQHRIPPLAKTDQGWLVSFALKSNEAVYGLGEKWGALNKRGQLIRSYNHDALGVNAEISYKNTPFAWSPEGWGLLVHTPSVVTHAVGYSHWSQRSYSVLIEDIDLDLFIFAEPNKNKNIAATMLKHYADLTGFAPTPPVWSTGVILSKAYYKDADEIISVAKEVRKRKMPCDVITFDGRAWQDTDTRFAFEWCRKRYPDPSSVIKQLKDLDFKICVWEYPLISVKHPWFKEFADKGWLLKDKRTGLAYEYYWDRQAFGKVLTPLPNSGIVDFTHPDAYAFWRDAHKPLFDQGIDMIKADFGEQLDDDNMLAHNGESGHSLHNVYAHLYNRCVFEACEKFSSSGAFIFSRSAWIGSQRFNSQWGGDPQADWEGMLANIRGGLSWGLSGAPFYATDVGGFYKDTRDDALYVRWAQAAVFSAHYRLHGIGEREPWSYSKDAENAVTKALNLRYRLQAYLQNAIQQACTQALPVQRPMVLAFPHEKQAWAFENQFMFGDDILVAPCFNPEGKVEFYLPKGDWLRFDIEKSTHKSYTGGQVHHELLALDEIAVFVRRGAQIALNAQVEFTEQLGKDIQTTEMWPRS